MRWILRIALVTFMMSSFKIFALENAFYILRSNSYDRITPYSSALKDLDEHFQKVDVLIAQAYHVDQFGVITGSIDDQTTQFANKHQLKLMVMLTNSLYDNERAHEFLADKAAQDKAIQELLTLCLENHFYGVQFDFEGLSIDNRNKLTLFFKNASTVLHAHGLKVSFAVIPNVSEKLRTSEFLIRKYNNWSGVYDLKALGKFADFITLMAYDQHSSGTTPGPFAGITWDEATLQNTLQYVPAEKISLGVPSYSSVWKTSSDISNLTKKISMQAAAIPYDDVLLILEKNQVNLAWDNIEKNNYAMFPIHFLSEYLFVEDKKSFAAKMDLVNKYHLRGISLFDLGNEDPQIWTMF